MTEKTAPFLSQLYAIVNDPSTDAMIRWSDDGQSFYLTDTDGLCQKVFPKQFRHSNLASFLRQLHNYGFRGRQLKNNGYEYRHEAFMRDKPFQLKTMRRKEKAPKPEMPTKAEFDQLFHEVRNLRSDVDDMRNQYTLLSSTLQRTLLRFETSLAGNVGAGAFSAPPPPPAFLPNAFGLSLSTLLPPNAALASAAAGPSASQRSVASTSSLAAQMVREQAADPTLRRSASSASASGVAASAAAITSGASQLAPLFSTLSQGSLQAADSLRLLEVASQQQQRLPLVHSSAAAAAFDSPSTAAAAVGLAGMRRSGSDAGAALPSAKQLVAAPRGAAAKGSPSGAQRVRRGGGEEETALAMTRMRQSLSQDAPQVGDSSLDVVLTRGRRGHAPAARGAPENVGDADAGADNANGGDDDDADDDDDDDDDATIITDEADADAAEAVASLRSGRVVSERHRASNEQTRATCDLLERVGDVAMRSAAAQQMMRLPSGVPLAPAPAADRRGDDELGELVSASQDQSLDVLQRIQRH